MGSPKKSKATVPSSQIPWLQYIEFKSRLLTIGHINQKLTKSTKQDTPKRRYAKLIKLLKNPHYFNCVQGIYHTWLIWPNLGNLYISVKIPVKGVIYFRFRASTKSDPLLELRLNVTTKEASVVVSRPQAPWEESDLENIINEFRALFPELNFASTQQYPAEAQTLTTRLQNTAQPVPKALKDESIFRLPSGKERVKVRVSSTYFQSFVFAEDALLKEFYPDDKFFHSLRYYQIVVSEEKDQSEAIILVLMTSLEALYMELFRLHAGITLSGTEILAIFKQLREIIQPQHLYLQDLANVFIPKPDGAAGEGINIPLRLMKLLTCDNTWYGEQLEVTPTDVTNVQSGWNKNVTLTQSTEDLYAAALYLRSMSAEIAEKYFPDRKIPEGKNIFAVIFDRKNLKTIDGFADLEKLNQLLTWVETHEKIVTQDGSREKMQKAEAKEVSEEKVQSVVEELKPVEKVHMTNKLESKTVGNAMNTIMNTRFYHRFFGEESTQKKRVIQASVSEVSVKRAKV